MAKLIDLTGRTFGRWRVLRRAPSRNTHAYWVCVCDPELGGCGKETPVEGVSLRRYAAGNRSSGSSSCNRCSRRSGRPAAAGSEKQKTAAIKLRAEGKTLAQIGTILRVSKQRVHQIIRSIS